MYKDCKYYNDGYCLNGQTKANGVPYDCIRRNDCPSCQEAVAKPQREEVIESFKNFRNSKGEIIK